MSEDHAGWENEDVELPAEVLANLPQPLYWRVLVMPVKPKMVSKGGILLAREAFDSQTYLNYTGKIVAVGDLAWQHPRFQLPDGTRCKHPQVGDYVIYGRYAGQPLTYKGYKFLSVNEDELLDICPDPSGLALQI